MFKNEANRFFNASDDNYQDFGWHEFTLEELGLPPAEDILKGVKAIEKEVGLIGWRTKHSTNENYKGFGITYNPTFHKDENPHHQVFGSRLSTQTFAQDDQEHEQLENTYYDTFGFDHLFHNLLRINLHFHHYHNLQMRLPSYFLHHLILRYRYLLL